MKFEEALNYLKSNRCSDGNYEEYDKYYDFVYNTVSEAICGGKVVQQEIDLSLSNSWFEYQSLYITAVLSIEEKYYKFDFSLSSWADDNAFGDVSLSDIEEVFPKEKVVTVYE